MSKHTPGPWHIGARTFIRPTLTIFHKPFGLGDVAEVYEDADAHLIAAAPELLEALQEVVPLLETLLAITNDPQPGSVGHKARSAIAKATGEPA